MDRYKLVHYNYDPFLGCTFVLGAVVECDGEVRFVECSRPLCKDCLGEGRNNLLQFILRALRSATNFDPITPAPTVTFGVERTLPHGCSFAWVSQFLNREPK